MTKPAIRPDAPIDHARRRQELYVECAKWLDTYGSESWPIARAQFLANFIERNVERWATDRARPGV